MTSSDEIPAPTTNGPASKADAAPVTNGTESKADAAPIVNGIENKEDSPAKYEPPGMRTDAKNLYQSKKDDDGNTTWVDKYPEDLEEAAENAETARYALLVRNKKCYDGRKKLQIDSIVVQSPLLRKALGPVFENYPGITTSLERLEFDAPFQPFIHCWSTLLEVASSETDRTTHEHLALLTSLLRAELHNDLKARDDYILNGVITYDTLWMIFGPRCFVFRGQSGDAARLYRAEYEEDNCSKYYDLRCEMVEWDGGKFGLNDFRWKIREFVGTAAITALTAFPLRYHPKLDEIKKELRDRGKVYESLCGYHFKYYQGVALKETVFGSVNVTVDSRIIIDTYGWNRFMPDKQVSVSSLADFASANARNNDSDDEYEEENTPVRDDDLPNYSTISLTPDQLLICSPSLKGYSMKNKSWLTFSIDQVKPIKWNDTAFSSLVLPGDHKDLILALAKSQMEKHTNTFDDVIEGKGRGMIMLLSGPPGVGKTLTAESVAETMRTPLYAMSASDLGFSSRDVEKSLSKVLELTAKWNAVLLLDEADVFLEARSAHDLERNKLVSIFLRILEYYEGTLFLTTNRVENIDAAFQSRIHVSMEYSELSHSSRRHVWENFLTASTSVSPNPPATLAPGQRFPGFSDKQLDKLAGYKMNGREIKNVLKTAKLLANSHKGNWDGVLAFEHVESVLRIEQRHVGSPPEPGMGTKRIVER